MKNYIFSACVLLTFAVLISACKGDTGDDPTPAELQTQALTGDYKATSSKTWSVSNVTFEGFEDRTADWSGFTVTVSSNPNGNNEYTTSGAFSPGPWPTSGTWRFGGTADNPNINKVIRDSSPEELDIAITVNNSQLVMIFTFDDAVHRSGRIEEVNGEYTFTFSN